MFYQICMKNLNNLLFNQRLQKTNLTFASLVIILNNSFKLNMKKSSFLMKIKNFINKDKVFYTLRLILNVS